MGTWRCPHCATLQVEAARCFVCGRSSTSCGTCVNFRRSLVGGLGYCALDRRREPLTGAEQRSCWSATRDAQPDGFFGESGVATETVNKRGRLIEKRGRLIELAPSTPSESEPPPLSGA